MNDRSVVSSLAELSTRATDNNLSREELSEKKIKEQKQNFFNLLAVQLKHQDPTSPMDTNQMTGQILAMSGLEQQLETNKILKSIYEIAKESQAVHSYSAIGKNAYYESDTLTLQDKEASIMYEIDKFVKDGEIQIKDGDRVIRTIPISPNSGSHIAEWDGKDAEGNEMPDGKYKIEIKAKDREDEEISIKTYVEGRIDGIGGYKNKSNSSIAKLTINGKEIDKDKIISISG